MSQTSLYSLSNSLGTTYISPYIYQPEVGLVGYTPTPTYEEQQTTTTPVSIVPTSATQLNTANTVMPTSNGQVAISSPAMEKHFEALNKSNSRSINDIIADHDAGIGLNALDQKRYDDYMANNSTMSNFAKGFGLVKDIGSFATGIGNLVMGYKNYKEAKRQADRAYNFTLQSANKQIDLLNKKSENANTVASAIAGKPLNNQIKLSYLS